VDSSDGLDAVPPTWARCLPVYTARYSGDYHTYFPVAGGVPRLHTRRTAGQPHKLTRFGGVWLPPTGPLPPAGRFHALPHHRPTRTAHRTTPAWLLPVRWAVGDFLALRTSRHLPRTLQHLGDVAPTRYLLPAYAMTPTPGRFYFLTRAARTHLLLPPPGSLPSGRTFHYVTAWSASHVLVPGLLVAKTWPTTYLPQQLLSGPCHIERFMDGGVRQVTLRFHYSWFALIQHTALTRRAPYFYPDADDAPFPLPTLAALCGDGWRLFDDGQNHHHGIPDTAS